jgi:hypothetical protein
LCPPHPPRQDQANSHENDLIAPYVFSRTGLEVNSTQRTSVAAVANLNNLFQFFRKMVRSLFSYLLFISTSFLTCA